jgi:hypothetical protein
MYKFQILTEGGNAGFDYNAVQFYCFTVISMFEKSTGPQRATEEKQTLLCQPSLDMSTPR